jgi:hypothetical protein
MPGYKQRGSQFMNTVAAGVRSARGAAQGLASTAQPHVQQATSRAVDWAADNPDKLESFGERLGQAAAVGSGGGLIAGRLGKNLGGKLGRAASRRAQDMSSSSSSDYDPLGDDPF